MTVRKPGLAVFSVETEHDGCSETDGCQEMSGYLSPMKSLYERSPMEKPMPTDAKEDEVV